MRPNMRETNRQEPLLEVQDICREYAGFALKDVSFSVSGGTITGLIGENGAGKSTLIRAILGVIRRDGGTVRLCGEEFQAKNREQKAQIGVVFDSVCFYKELTLDEIEKIFRKSYADWDEAYFWELSERFSLRAEQKVKTLSRGMSMKLSLAVALAHRPKLLILDEPTAGLDSVVRDDLMDIFLDFVGDEEHSVLISSHVTSDLEKIADNIAYLHQGKLLLHESKEVLTEQYGILRCGERQFRALSAEEMFAWRKKDYSYDVLITDREKTARRYSSAVIDRATPDEIMVICTKGEIVS